MSAFSADGDEMPAPDDDGEGKSRSRVRSAVHQDLRALSRHAEYIDDDLPGTLRGAQRIRLSPRGADWWRTV